MSRESGFTLVELLLSVAIITLLAGMSVPVFATFNQRNDLDLTTFTIASMLRRAQTYARGSDLDSQWGVYVQSGSAVVFKGASYAARDSTQDETTTLPAAIIPSGTSEIVFAKLSGSPATTGAITLTNNTNDARTVSINAKGMVGY